MQADNQTFCIVSVAIAAEIICAEHGSSQLQASDSFDKYLKEKNL